MTTEKTHIGGFELNLTAKQKMRSGTIESDSPFCVAILGDFSNRANKASSPSTSFGKQRIFEIDRDNFDDVIKSLAIRVQLLSFKATSSTIDFPITELEDFHPDQLYQHVGFFDKLRDLREKLLDPATFNAAADEVSSWFSGKEEIATDTDDNLHNTESQTSLLDAVISSSEHNAAQIKTTTGSELVDELIKEAIADYRIPAVDARQQEFVAAVDEAIAAQMRYILHHPQFQNIEAAWKAVYFLVRRLETGSRLKLFLIDIPKNELREDLSCNDLENTQLYKLLCDSPTGNIEWSLLMGNYTFSANMDDVHLLDKIGYIS